MKKPTYISIPVLNYILSLQPDQLPTISSIFTYISPNLALTITQNRKSKQLTLEITNLQTKTLIYSVLVNETGKLTFIPLSTKSSNYSSHSIEKTYREIHEWAIKIFIIRPQS